MWYLQLAFHQLLLYIHMICSYRLLGTYSEIIEKWCKKTLNLNMHLHGLLLTSMEVVRFNLLATIP
jgi:hypothetical protein